jgi:hypothetical protein
LEEDEDEEAAPSNSSVGSDDVVMAQVDWIKLRLGKRIN